MTMGRLVTGSIIRPLMNISTSMGCLAFRALHERLSAKAVRTRARDAHRKNTSDPIDGPGKIHDGIPSRSPRQLTLVPAGDRVNQDWLDRSNRGGMARQLDVSLQGLQSHDPMCLLPFRHVIFQPLVRER